MLRGTVIRKIRPRDEAEELLRQYILDNNIKGQLPSERELCEKLPFSRTTLRFAMQRLKMSHLLYSKRGSGNYINPPKFQRHLQSLESWTEFAQNLELPYCTLVLNFTHIEAPKTVAQNLHLGLGAEVYEIERLRVLNETPTSLETAYLSVDRFPNLENYDFSKESLYNVLQKNYHINILSGHEQIQISFPTIKEMQLLKVTQETPLFFVEGITYDQDKIPVEYMKSLSLSDRIEFVSTIKELLHKGDIDE